MRDIAITTECVADIPKELLRKKHIDIIYFDVQTDSGIFRDTEEIDAQNITEYMMGGQKKALSIISSANDYKNFFKKELEEYDEVIHIAISGNTSGALENAKLGRAKMGLDGRKIHLIDSKHLSSGCGLLALEAAKCRDQGLGSEEIVAKIEEMIPRVSTSFICDNADYLYFNGKVSKTVMRLSRALYLHPVLHMKDGVLTLKTVYVGNYDRAAKRYIADTLKYSPLISSDIGFITYVGCSHDKLLKVEERVFSHVTFRKLWRQQASATISANSGPLTFGILFVYREGV